MSQTPEALQKRSLAAFLSLVQRHDTCSQRLIMLSASGEAEAFAMGGLAAGAAVLWVCKDETALRDSGRHGLSDFQVTTLGEALRILKNEIRKRLPVSVAVLDASRSTWAEAVSRGVQPTAVLAGSADSGQAAILLQRGADPLYVPECGGIAEYPAQSWRELREIDTRLLQEAAMLPLSERSAAERWLRAGPRLFPRDLRRCYLSAWTASNQSR